MRRRYETVLIILALVIAVLILCDLHFSTYLLSMGEPDSRKKETGKNPNRDKVRQVKTLPLQQENVCTQGALGHVCVNTSKQPLYYSCAKYPNWEEKVREYEKAEREREKRFLLSLAEFPVAKRYDWLAASSKYIRGTEQWDLEVICSGSQRALKPLLQLLIEAYPNEMIPHIIAEGVANNETSDNSLLALVALARERDRRIYAALFKLSDDDNIGTQRIAISALGYYDFPEVERLLLEKLKSLKVIEKDVAESYEPGEDNISKQSRFSNVYRYRSKHTEGLEPLAALLNRPLTDSSVAFLKDFAEQNPQLKVMILDRLKEQVVHKDRDEFIRTAKRFLLPENSQTFKTIAQDCDFYLQWLCDKIVQDRMGDLSYILYESLQQMAKYSNLDTPEKVYGIVEKIKNGEENSHYEWIPLKEIALAIHKLGYKLPDEYSQLLYALRWIGDPKEHLRKAGWLEGIEE